MFKITGAEQMCPKEAIKSCNFKSSLLRFLADGWRNQAYLDIIIFCMLGLKTRHIAMMCMSILFKGMDLMKRRTLA